MINKFITIFNEAKHRPIYEKIFFIFALFSVFGAAYYYICYLPYCGNSETFHPLLLAKEIIRTGSIFPSSWTFRNDVWFLYPQWLFVIPALFTDNTAVCCIFAGIVTMLGSFAILIYCSRKVSSNNCFLLVIPIVWCGICSDYISFMFKQYNCIFQILMVFLVYAMFAHVFDEDLSVKSMKTFIASCIIIALMGISGLRSLQSFALPLLGGVVLFFLIRTVSEHDNPVVNSKSIKNLFISAAAITVFSAIGFSLYYILTSNNIISFYQTSESKIKMVNDIGENLHQLLVYFVNISGVVDQSDFFSLDNLFHMIKLALNFFLLFVFPVLQLLKYKNESTPMKLFTLFSFIHVAEILFLSIFTTALSAQRYLYSSVLLLYYLSAHYIYKYILPQNHKFELKSFCTAAAAALFIIPSTCGLLNKVGSYDENVKNAHSVTDTLLDKGLTYGYGTYWNSDRFTGLSDSQIRINKVNVDKQISIQSFMTSDYYYSEDAYQGPSFLLLEESENETFLASASYVKFGEPKEVFNISEFTVYIYDYNIANNNFGGEFGGFTGSELEQINAACRENSIDVAFGLENGGITSVIRGGINNIDEISADTTILAVTHDVLAEPAQKLDTTVGEYDLYVCSMGELDFTPGDNLVAGSDFDNEDDLEKWSVGGGETVSCSDGALTITCTRESDRRFDQTVTISEEQVGKPMTFSIKVNKVTGESVSRVWGDDFKENRYNTAYISEPGVYCFTFTPTSTQITVQPIVPSTLNSSAEIDWVKLESCIIFTGFIPAMVNPNFAD